MYGQVNDLRSMNMLGAKLSVEYRRKIGVFCKENKIGFHKFTREESVAFGKIGGEIAFKNKLGYHGLSEEDRKKNAILGGKAGGKTTHEKQVGIFALSEEERLRNCSLGGKATGGWNKGMKCWTKDSVTVLAEECPGDGWKNEVILSDKQIEHYDTLKNFYEIRVIKKSTGKQTKLFIPKSEDIAKFIMQHDDIEIFRKSVNVIKHDIVINIPKNTIQIFTSYGWKIYLDKVDTKKKRNQNVTMMYFGEYRTHIPNDKIEVFIADGWSTTNPKSSNKYKTFFANGYKLQVKNCDDVQVYTKYGWRLIDYKEGKSINSNNIEQGIRMRFKETGALIRVAFKDVRKMQESYGLEPICNNQKDLRKIIARLNSLSESNGD